MQELERLGGRGSEDGEGQEGRVGLCGGWIKRAERCATKGRVVGRCAPSYVTESQRPANISGGMSRLWPSVESLVACASSAAADEDTAPDEEDGAGLRM